MNTENGALDTLIQERIDADTDFQTEIEELEEDERDSRIEERRKEILEEEFNARSEDAKKNKELADNYKTRAEKAEAIAKGKKQEEGKTEPVEEKKEDDLSAKDLYALMNAKVHEDDVDEVVKAAKLLEKSIPDALKDDTLQTILQKRTEHRKTAEATSTGGRRATTKKVDASELLKEASKGNIPDAGSAEAEELFWARRGGRK